MIRGLVDGSAIARVHLVFLSGSVAVPMRFIHCVSLVSGKESLHPHKGAKKKRDRQRLENETIGRDTVQQTLCKALLRFTDMVFCGDTVMLRFELTDLLFNSSLYEHLLYEWSMV